MKTSELRNELVAWLSSVDDRAVLDAVAALREQEDGDGWLIELTQEQKDHIAKGLQDHEEGNVLTSEEFWKLHGKEA